MTNSSKGIIFVLLAVAQFMLVLDVSIVNVALPAIKQDLAFGDHSLSWVVTAYAIVFGGFLLLGGRAADLFGRRRVLLAGITGFTVFSLLLGLAPSAGALVVLRALQGLAAAIMSPAALSIIVVTFREGDERNRAFGLWTTIAASGAALGLLLGGVFSQYLNWRWNFFINVPTGVLDALLILRFVPKHASTAGHRHLDLAGAVLVTTGLITLVFGLNQASEWGWLQLRTLGVFAAALALLGAFLWNESRSRHPLVPLGIFKNRNLSGANLMMAPIYATMMGTFFLLSLYIQTVLRFSPVLTGLAFLPFPVVMGLTSSRVSRLVTRVGFKPFLLLGPTLIVVALAWLSRIPVDGWYWVDVLPSLILMPLGTGLTFMPIVAAATSGVGADNAGLASGLINTSQMMGGAMGLAFLSGLAASVGALQTASPAVLVQGYRIAFAGAVAFLLFALVIAMTVIRQGKGPGLTLELPNAEPPAA